MNPEEASAEALATPEAPAEPSLEEKLDAIWEEGNAEPEEEVVEEAVEAVEEAEVVDEAPEEVVEEVAEVEAVAEPSEAPSDMPKGVKESWSKLTPDAQEAVVNAHREMAVKLREQGRQVEGIAPIRDVLIEATKTIPSLANMKPDQAAAEILGLAQISHQFTAQPVETMMGLIRKHGLESHIKAALDGQNTAPQAAESAQIRQQLANVERQVQRMSDPQYVQEQIATGNDVLAVQSEIASFAQNAEHWDVAEKHMPKAIVAVKEVLGDSASAKDVLSIAYDQVVSLVVPEAKAKTASAPVEAAPAADPETTQKALKAKSVNVAGTAQGKPRPKTLRQAQQEAWDRMHAN